MAETPSEAEGSLAPHSPAQETVHATCLVLGEDGVLLRGASGAGKSSLCLALLDEADRAGLHARLVGDDRICLARHHGRIVARPHPALAGLIEIRGAGIRRLAHSAEAAVIRLVVDLVDERPRLPGDGPNTTGILGLDLAYLILERAQPRNYVIRDALAALRQQRHIIYGGASVGVASQTHSAALLPVTERAP